MNVKLLALFLMLALGPTAAPALWAQERERDDAPPAPRDEARDADRERADEGRSPSDQRPGLYRERTTRSYQPGQAPGKGPYQGPVQGPMQAPEKQAPEQAPAQAPGKDMGQAPYGQPYTVGYAPQCVGCQPTYYRAAAPTYPRYTARRGLFRRWR